MQLCPRCASTVEDDAMLCGVCAAPIWQPPGGPAPVAVTPAPVALVLPSPPPAGPPPLPAVPETHETRTTRFDTPEWVPTVGANASVREVVVKPPQLPPQRIASVDPPAPARPDANPTVLPTPAKSNHLAAGAGGFVAILLVVGMVFALPAHGARQDHHPLLVATSANAQFDLRALAAAEETSLTATRVYTIDGAALAAAGYQPMPDAPVTVLAGINRKRGYCLVASAGRGAPWFLYDSGQGGLLNGSFATQTLAQAACADSTIASFAAVG